MTGRFLLDWAIQAVSLFNVILLIWLGLTVLFNAERRTGGILLMATPVVFAVTHSPVVLLAELVLGLGILASTVVIHIFTLPTEFDASFKRALPILENYLRPEDMPGARQVLKAAAFTYVASALVSILNIARWLRILRF
jgi:Zn-dependent membrane protease YugP